MATEDNKSGGIFPNFSHLLVLVLAGALFASQNPYHEQRPDKSNFHRDAPGKIHDVDARLWQDPFEAALLHEQDDINEQALNHSATINHKIANQHLDATITVTSKLDSMEGHKIEAFANDLENRLIANQAKQLDVIAVMLPGGAYSEESELRRRIRYAVLSGLYATKQYQSEDAEHIRYFLLDQKDNIGNKAAYEWVVDRSKNHNPPFITKDNKPVSYTHLTLPTNREV